MNNSKLSAAGSSILGDTLSTAGLAALAESMSNHLAVAVGASTSVNDAMTLTNTLSIASISPRVYL